MYSNGSVLQCVFFGGLFYVCTAGSFFDQKRLYSDLADNINPRFRPVLNQSQALTVSFFWNLQSIIEIDEREQSMESSFAISFRWTYETLQWNSSDYGGNSKLTLLADETWIPEVLVSNALRNEHQMLFSNGWNVDVYNSGVAQWHTGGTFKTTCPINISKYPFDTQTCVVILRKYVADGELEIVSLANEVFLTVYTENDEWFLESSSITNQTTSPGLSSILVSLTLQRRPLFYIINIIIPVVMVSFMNLLSFKIPPRSGERMSYCVALLLTFAVLLNSTGETMPRLSENVAYLQIYINFQFILAFLVTTVSALMVKAVHSETQTGLPQWLKRLLLLSCCRRNIEGVSIKTVDTKVENVENNGVEKNVTTDKKEETVCSKEEHLIDCLDNALFYIFVALFALSTIVCASLILT